MEKKEAMRVDLVCFEAITACSALLFLDSLYSHSQFLGFLSMELSLPFESSELIRMSLIFIGVIAAITALLYRFLAGVRVLRPSCHRCSSKSGMSPS